jgi:hypothetical protein
MGSESGFRTGSESSFETRIAGLKVGVSLAFWLCIVN